MSTANKMLDLAGAIKDAIGWTENAACAAGDECEEVGSWPEMEEVRQLLNEAFKNLEKAEKILEPYEKHAQEELDEIEALADATSY